MDDYVPYPSRILVDANTIVSATLSDGVVRELLLVTEDDCYAPVFLREEIERYEPMLRERSGLSEDELDALLGRLFRRITFLSTERTVRHHDRAESVMRAIDPKDALYVAAGLELDAAIWSMDDELSEQSVVLCLANSAMVARVRGGQLIE
ncbi:hypothetical protein BRC86_14055 [Halobacteriales archaeon QS_3_64_16]|nr:MAG: hypothetical protein BRC86_14055 [Halobacteriales archaeon QS_3_64_16]